MKIFRSFLAAAAMSVAALSFSSAHAAPNRDAPNYYLVGVNEEVLMLLSSDLERDGAKATGWTLAYRAQPLQTENGPVQGVWVLNRFDCQNSTVEVMQIDAFTPDMMLLASFPGDGKVRSVQAGSPYDVTLTAVCRREVNKADEPIIMTKVEAIDLLNAYVKSTQPAS